MVLLTWLLLLYAAVQAYRLSAVWRRGASAKVDWAAGLAAVPRRYLVDVHHIVAKKPEAARMHMVVAGGLLAGTVLLLLGVLPWLRASHVYWIFVAMAFGFAVAGALMVARRRRPMRPANLSGGKFNALPVWISCYAIGGFLAAIGAGFFGVPLAALGGVMLVRQVYNGPMRHALAGALHLAVHPRPERFAGAVASGLAPAKLDDAAALGAAAINDFSWNRLLGFDSCIQCGRCEEACPAFAAELPLNPKALIQDFCAAMRPGEAHEYAGSPHPGMTMLGPILGQIHAETLWACTTCRACVAACPMMIEHVDAVIDLRRHQTLALGAAPGKSAAALAGLRYASNPGGHALSSRLDFAGGMDVRILAEGDQAEILLWLGDGAFDTRYGQTLRALIEILQAARLDFAVLGEAEQDCGDLARRLGDEAGFAGLARENIRVLQSRRFNRIVTADPHALHVLRNEYPGYGGNFAVQHHTALIDDLLASGRLKVAQGDLPITYHDPCYLGRYNNETAAPRRILARLTGNVVEMARHGKNAFCCGGGGGAPVTDIPGKRRIPDLRMEQAAATGAAIVAVACPGCTVMLEGVVQPRAEIRDIAELVRDAMVVQSSKVLEPA
jgi:Fe-S oxidoreductase